MYQRDFHQKEHKPLIHFQNHNLKLLLIEEQKLALVYQEITKVDAPKRAECFCC